MYVYVYSFCKVSLWARAADKCNSSQITKNNCLATPTAALRHTHANNKCIPKMKQ